jgi:very-short-patch-repair endonuclease
MRKSGLTGEQIFELDCRKQGLRPEREHRFSPTRRWRFDFAFPESKLAVEVEGGVWTAGRHTRGTGFSKDCEKYAEAAVLGWRVIRVTTEMVNDGSAINYTLRALGGTT